MRGPQDEHINATDRAGEAGEVAAQRTPGGKALIRVLQLLESRGLEAAAAGVINAAAPQHSKALFYARAERFTASPSRLVTRREDGEAKLRGETTQAGVEEIARELMALTPPSDRE